MPSFSRLFAHSSQIKRMRIKRILAIKSQKKDVRPLFETYVRKYTQTITLWSRYFVIYGAENVKQAKKLAKKNRYKRKTLLYEVQGYRDTDTSCLLNFLQIKYKSR